MIGLDLAGLLQPKRFYVSMILRPPEYSRYYEAIKELHIHYNTSLGHFSKYVHKPHVWLVMKNFQFSSEHNSKQFKAEFPECSPQICPTNKSLYQTSNMVHFLQESQMEL